MLSKSLEKWLNEHQPDGFGNGSVGEASLWHFVHAIFDGKEDAIIDGRTKELISAIDTDYNIRTRLRQITNEIKKINADIIFELDKPTTFGSVEPTVNMVENLRQLQRDKRLLEYLTR